MRFKTLTLATASLLAVAAAPAVNAAKPVYGDWGYDRAAMDSSVKPGDDFWAYVNGDWDKKTQIAADRASAGPFVTLSDGAERDVRQIVEQLASDPSRDHLGQQVGDYYSSFVDTNAIDAAGTAPLKPYLAQINAAKTRNQLLSLFIKPGFASPVDVGIGPNFKNPDVYAVFAGQARLGMPSREYYLEDNAKMKAHRAAYRGYIVTIEKLAGLPDPEAAADRIVALETELSKVQWPAADRRDIDKIYNPMTRAQLVKLAPQFDWNATLAKARPRQRQDGDRDRALRRRRRRQDPRLDAAVDLEGMARLPLRLRSCRRAAQGVRRRALRLLFEGALGRSAAARALEARRCCGQWRARRRRRRDLREDALPRAVRAADAAS